MARPARLVPTGQMGAGCGLVEDDVQSGALQERVPALQNRFIGFRFEAEDDHIERIGGHPLRTEIERITLDHDLAAGTRQGITKLVACITAAAEHGDLQGPSHRSGSPARVRRHA